MSFEVLMYVFAVVNNSSLIIHRPTWNINAAYLCAEFSDTGNVRTNCTWPYDWTRMRLKSDNILNRTKIDTFVNEFRNPIDDRPLLFYKVRFVNQDRSYVETDWKSLIWNLDSYRSIYANIFNRDDYAIYNMILISVVLFQMTVFSIYWTYREILDLIFNR